MNSIAPIGRGCELTVTVTVTFQFDVELGLEESVSGFA
jgi:hypothetical protein